MTNFFKICCRAQFLNAATVRFNLNFTLIAIICVALIIFLLSPSYPVEAAPKKSDKVSVVSAKAELKRVSIDPIKSQTRLISEDELLILQMEMTGFLLIDAMPGYPNQGSVLLPLQDVTEALDFAISSDPDTGRAGGWFLSENRLFSLNIDRSVAIYDGRTEKFPPEMARVIDGDIFVDARLIAKWFPVDISFDLSNLLVEIESREPLPIEQKLERNQRRKKALAQKTRTGEKTPTRPVPYEYLSWPVTDTSLEFNFDKSDTGSTKGIVQNTHSTFDVGKLNADLFLVSTDSKQFSQARLKLGRKDVSGNLLGFLKASEFEVGDIATPQMALVSSTEIGRGAMFSNIPINSPTEFGRITLQGDLPVGWEVELYRNEVLLDFRESQTDGRYVFEDTPLLFGVNVIRLAFYGPQGQTRDEVKQIRVGADQVKPGKSRYRAAFNQQERQLLLGNIDEPSNTELQGKSRLMGEYAYGFSRELAIGSSFISLPFSGGRRNYVGVLATAVLGNYYVRADISRDVSRGWAGRVSGQTAIMGVSINAEYTALKNFSSEQFSDTDTPTKNIAEARLDGVVKLGGIAHVPVSLKGARTIKVGGDSETELTNRISGAFGPASFSNTLNWSRTISDGTRTTALSGNVLLGGRIGKFKVRGQLGYNVDPITELSTTSLTADWSLTKNITASTAVAIELTDDKLKTYSMGLTSIFDLAAVGLDMDYTSDNDISGRLTMSFSTNRDRQSGEFYIQSTKLANAGTVTSRVFLDNNFNGRFDEGDEALKDVSFMVNRSETRAATNANGQAILTGLDTYNPIKVSVATGSLEDPFWVATPEAVLVTLRPGASVNIDFPVVSTGEIDGTVYKRDGEWAGEVADVMLQLVDDKGQVKRETQTSFDGFYLFDFVVPGTYFLRVDPDQVVRLKLDAPSPKKVVIDGDGTIINGEDIVLEKTVSEKSYRLLLSVFASKQAAEKAWKKLQAKLSEPLNDLQPTIVADTKTVVNGKDKTVYRLFVGPLSSRKQGTELCLSVRDAEDEGWCNPLRVQRR